MASDSTTVKGLSIKIGADVSDLGKKMNEANKAISSTQGELRKIDKALKLDPTNVVLMTQKQQMLGKQITATEQNLKTLLEAEENIEQQFQNGEIGEEAYRAFQREIGVTNAKLNKLKDQSAELEDQLAVPAEDAADAQNELAEATEKAKNESETQIATVKNLAGEFGALAGKALSVSAAVAAVTEAMKEGAEFESSLAKVNTIMDTSAVSVGNMGDSIRKLSSDMGISAEELSNTVYNAISATGDTENAAKLAEQASKLAAAGFTDTDSALSVLTTTMNAYGISAEEVGDISDSLVQVQNLGVTTIGELSNSMGKAIASASAYGVDLTNLESGYVSLTKAGINTNESTTYMSALFKELGDTGSEVSKIIKEQTGQSFSELMDGGSSLADVLGVLYDAVDGDTTALMNLWGSAEAGKASNAIISQGLDEFNNNLKLIGESANATENAYGIMADTVSHKTDVLKNNAKNFASALTAGGDIAGAFEDLAASGADYAEGIGEMLMTMGEQSTNLLHSAAEEMGVTGDAADVLVAAIKMGVEGLTTFVAVSSGQKMIAGISSYVQNMIAARAATKAQNTELATTQTLTAGIAAAAVMGGQLIASAVDKATDSIDETCESLDTASEESKEFLKQTQELAKANSELRDKTRDSIAETEAQAGGYEQMTERLYELNAAGELTSEEQEEMKAIADELNGSIEGMNIEIDKQTGHLKTQRSEVEKVIDSYKKEAKVQAARESLTELYKQQFEATENLEKAETDYFAAHEEGWSGTEDELRNVNMAYINAKETIMDVNEDIDSMTLIINENAEAQRNAANEVEKTSKKIAANGSTLSGVLSAQVESVSAQGDIIAGIAAINQEYDDMLSSTTESIYNSLDLFNTFPEQVDRSKEELVAALSSNLDALDEWSAGVESLMGNENISEALVEQLREAGPSSVAEVRALNTMTEEELKDYSDKFDSAYKKSQAAAEIGLSNIKKENENRIQDVVDVVKEKSSAVERAFENMGEYGSIGFADGLISKFGLVANAAEDMVICAVSAAKEAGLIRSPSRVMRDEVGIYLAQGVGVGFEEEMRNVNAVMANALPKSFDIDTDTNVNVGNTGAGRLQSTSNVQVPEKAVLQFNVDGKTLAETLVPFVDIIQGAKISAARRGVTQI